MIPGFYVARRPHGQRQRVRLTIESVTFATQEDADRWRDYTTSLFPKDDVFVIEVKAEIA